MRKPLVAAVLALSCAFAGFAQQSTESAGTPAAKALFDQGQAFMRVSQVDFAKAAGFFRQAIDADPRFVEAHSRFILTSREAATRAALSEKPGDVAFERAARDQAGKDLERLYAGWAKAHPDNAVYEWALGTIIGASDYTEAERHYLRAIAIDSNMARVYTELALIADLRGEYQRQVDYLKKATDLNPADPGYYFSWTSAMKWIDPAKSIALLQTVADKFPGTERGAQGLYWAAFETTDRARKLAIYERLRKEFPPEAPGWSKSAMGPLFDLYGRFAPDKALALAEDLAARMTTPSDQKTWQEYTAFARTGIDARRLIALGKPGEAIALIDKTTRPKGINTAAFDIIKALARDASGDRQQAYDELAVTVARTPTDDLLAVLGDYGKKLGKDASAVDADLWKLRDADAKPAQAFSLPDYPDGKIVNLSDYKGRVVLVNFWYPSCGPCRGEFPTLQRVLDKYKDRGFVILALNVLPPEDALVMPYMQNSHFGFRPLKTDTDWAEKNYGAKGYPTNALVDAQGRIVFKPGLVRGGDEQRTLELQVEALLRQIRK